MNLNNEQDNVGFHMDWNRKLFYNQNLLKVYI